ncbi:MAG: outer membrane protein assembly factor BamD, partial [Polyangiaceae bacterium]|nr:outer membrane protein assembly factor BamD [Polyangiaceae bacterium]
GTGTAAGTGTGAAAGTASLIKSILVGAASAGLLLVGYAVLGPESPAPTTPAVVEIAPSENAPIAAQPQAPPSAEPEVPVAPSTQSLDSPRPNHAALPPAGIAAPSTPSAASSATAPLTPTERANKLREESLLLSEARDALRRGDASGALQRLEEARSRFAGGMLGQEREALTIEALHKSGQKSAASARAATFLRAYPLSPHAARVQTFLQ